MVNAISEGEERVARQANTLPAETITQQAMQPGQHHLAE